MAAPTAIQSSPQSDETTTLIEYPESDGQPMGETEIHVVATLRLYDALLLFFHDRQDVYVAADMFLYYEEGNPAASKASDVMIIKGVEKRRRRTFKIWEEGAAPTVVIEITSKSTQSQDTINKSTLYAALGVREYFIFDPLAEYLNPPFQGYRLEHREYVPLEPDADGSITSAELGLILRPREDRLRIVDPETGELIPEPLEAVARAAEATQRAEQESQRANAAEAEAARLRTLLEKLQGNAPDEPSAE